VFERFTDRARRVLVLAQEEARLLNHSFIGTEHILLGLIHEGEGVAAKALEQLGVSLEAVREKVEETIGLSGTAPTGSPHAEGMGDAVGTLRSREGERPGASWHTMPGRLCSVFEPSREAVWCSNASLIGREGCWCWRRKKRAC
jgi:ATP-dependent Clp protease ATP-binding subunit ClpC